MRTWFLTTLLVLTAAPASAAPLTFSGVARIYCEAIISGRMTPVLALLTDDLRQALGDQAEVPLLWQGSPQPVETCFPVGNRGTYDRPETIVSLGAAGKPGFSETIVMVFVGDELRIDDVVFPDGTTLRGRLAVNA